jgi:hypothetical protein
MLELLLFIPLWLSTRFMKSAHQRLLLRVGLSLVALGDGEPTRRAGRGADGGGADTRAFGIHVAGIGQGGRLQNDCKKQKRGTCT